ncbi:MAG: gamma-glutamyl-gamma-aminobutyrate hydrolase family protein [Prolixibacteraceae bacterium]|nr:gamma-glutamyl-gamma-aminobutyrate hydrolase family protein [Prolixibacteraceae bacterium]
MKTMLIIKCGETFPETKVTFGDFEDWIIARSGLPANVFKIVDVANGAQLKHPSEYVAAIITGSQANVDDDLPWIEPLENWILTARYSNVPILGICFGHQLIAKAFGGKVILNPAGMSLGIININVTEEGKNNKLFKQTGSNFESFVHHAYIVDSLPNLASILATNDQGVVYAFSFDKICGIQFHPEFSPEIMQHYFDLLKINNARKNRFILKSSFKNDSIISNFIDDSLIL